MQLTLNFPPWLAKYDATEATSGPRGSNILTPVAGQVSIDPNLVNLAHLLASGFTIAPGVGATAARPSINVYPGMYFFDTTLGYPVFRNAANSGWVSATGATV